MRCGGSRRNPNDVGSETFPQVDRGKELAEDLHVMPTPIEQGANQWQPEPRQPREVVDRVTGWARLNQADAHASPDRPAVPADQGRKPQAIGPLGPHP